MDKSLDEIIESSDAGQARSGGPKPAKASGSARSSRGSRGSRGVAKGGARRSAGKGAGFKAVFIRNLSDAVTEDDLRDLFRQVGPVVRVHVERTDAGDRTGLAWVLYDYAEDALVAAGRYNQRRAAGKVITVRQVAHVGDTGSGLGPLSDRIGGAGGDRAGAGAGASRSSRRSRRGRGSKPKEGAAKPNPSRSAADLDAELDAYMQVESNVPLAADQGSAPAAAPAPPRPAEDSMIDV